MYLDSVIFFTNDLNAAVEFYTEVLEMELEYQQGDAYASLLFSNNIRLGIKRPTEERERPGSQTFFVSADNIENWYDRMQSQGIEIYTELREKSWGWEFSVLDPDGNKVLFIRRK